jgi:hypothetical protein
MPQLHCTHPEEALRACVDALGGPQKVASRMRPTMHPILAGQWLSHCLEVGHRQKPSLSQIVWLLAEARAIGFHAGAEEFNRLVGYRVTAAVDEREAIADMARQAQQRLAEATSLTQEMLARADALHLKVRE